MKAAQPEVLAATRVNPGETLRLARENNGWTLAEVALKLNLTASSLSNLESGAFDKLPGHTFARGYIRAYAKLLGMDQTRLVHEFDVYTGTDANGSNVHSLGRIEEPVRVSHTILRIVSLVLLIAVLFGGFFWWQDQASMRAKDLIGLTPEHVEVEGADGTTQIHPLDEPEDQAVAQANAQGDIAPQPAPEATGSTELPLPIAPTASPAPTTAPATSGTPTQPTTPAAAVAPAAPAVVPATPQTDTAAATTGPGKVTINYTADCWSQVTDSTGKVLFSGLKRKGETLDVTGKPPLSLRLGYARGAQVTYNGQVVDVAPFTSGETARLKLGQ
ncbi:Cro/Cl family transcriptional regulator [Pseudomonas endophytica]|uniref:Cro/Cl family transcriptional regulator n=1 Tax=Pseudomonas endophytica TaxID=1563157 RepID=A0A0Q0SR50_9PSED|nr:RodZ family helix-turn-helix domain-containing protein [Pseudomonas endophytica]KQB54574.1 Cro/Cl family transcriptional regulator [Pseudomonas endophytica]